MTRILNGSFGRQLLVSMILAVCAVVPARATTTLMVMVDFWGQRDQTDTIIGLNVYQPAAEIRMVDSSAVPNPVLTEAYETEKFGWWYALPNFNADAYSAGRIQIHTRYLRGWYQLDSSYVVPRDTTLILPDAQTTFRYWKPGVLGDTTVSLPTKLPKSIDLQAGWIFRVPKLYTTQGNSETGLLNMRRLDSTGNQIPGTGNIDKCIDSLRSDTVWIRWGTPTNPPGQSPLTSGMKCFGSNPFLPPPVASTRQRFEPVVSSDRLRLVLIKSGFRLLPDGSRNVIGRR